jgi:hypothetical protein
MGFYPFAETSAPAAAVFAGQTARTVTDAVTNGTTTITSATASFTAGDAGKLAILTGGADGDAVAGNYFSSTIASVTNSTTAVLAAAPTWSESFVNLVIGADNSVALAAFMTHISGGQGQIPAGVYAYATPQTLPGGTTLTGTGYDTEQLAPNYSPQLGSVLVFGGPAGTVTAFTMGGSGYVAASINPMLQMISIDGSNLCQTVVTALGNRSQLWQCNIMRGTSRALAIEGGTTWTTSCYLAQQNIGDVVTVTGGDCHMLGNVIRQPGSGGACCRALNINDFLFVANHSWSFYNSAVSSTYPSNNMIIQNNGSGTDCDNYTITGNLFDGVYGHSIVITCSGGSSARISYVCITGNSFRANSGFPANTFYAVYCDPQAASNIRGLTVDGNTITGVDGSANNFAGILGNSAAGGSLSQFSVMGNAGMGVASAWPSTSRPDGGRVGNIFTTVNTSATSVGSSGDGVATFSGTGAQTAFVINHGLFTTPVTVQVTAATSAAAASFYITVSATQITVTYLVAPAAGASNVVLNWWASL